MINFNGIDNILFYIRFNFISLPPNIYPTKYTLKNIANASDTKNYLLFDANSRALIALHRFSYRLIFWNINDSIFKAV